MPAPTQYSQAGGPLIAVAALVVIILICRWVFATDHRDDRAAKRLAKLRAQGDYGLLVPVATVRTREDGELLRGVLREGGIRGTVTPGQQLTAGQHPEWVVLVFRVDADRARTLVSS